jgi:mRNA-degrading endonuclease toxin of MazEF toxin-antitoxin module
MVGKVFLAKIYFTNNEDYKIRPILVIQKNSFGDLIYIPFTTEPSNLNSIKFLNSDLEIGEFKKTSYLIVDKTCTINSSLLQKEIAKIKIEKLNFILKKYCDFLHKG